MFIWCLVYPLLYSDMNTAFLSPASITTLSPSALLRHEYCLLISGFYHHIVTFLPDVSDVGQQVAHLLLQVLQGRHGHHLSAHYGSTVHLSPVLVRMTFML